jgi:hypothetical protein
MQTHLLRVPYGLYALLYCVQCYLPALLLAPWLVVYPAFFRSHSVWGHVFVHSCVCFVCLCVFCLFVCVYDCVCDSFYDCVCLCEYSLCVCVCVCVRARAQVCLPVDFILAVPGLVDCKYMVHVYGSHSV